MKKIFAINLLFVFSFFIITSSLASDLPTHNEAEKILIMTYVHSRPDFIRLHIKTFDAFLKEPYRYVVFNDAPNPAMSSQIEQTCRELHVQCFRVPPHKPNRQDAGARHCDGIRFSLDKIGLNYKGIVMIVDADMFLIKPFSATEYMQEYDFAGGFQFRSNDLTKVVYTSPCLVFMNMPKLPNKNTLSFEGGHIQSLPCDVGGQTYHYLRNDPSVKMKFYTALTTDTLQKDRSLLQKEYYDDTSINFILNIKWPYGMEFHGDGYFLHYYAGGSNWPRYDQKFLAEKISF